MGIFGQIRLFFNKFFEKTEPGDNSSGGAQQIVYQQQPLIQEIHSIWDYIKFTTHTQAHHICSVLGFEEWVPMDEILRRIKELFGVEYQNERSLYPYIKTLVDCGLLETAGFAGKKHWRKKDMIIKIEPGKQKQSAQIEEKVTAKNSI